MLDWCLLILITLFEIQTGIASKYSEVSIIESLPLERNHTFLINFLKTGQYIRTSPTFSMITYSGLMKNLK